MAENTFDILRAVVESARCRGWKFKIIDEDGALRLVITISGRDNYEPDRKFTVSHYHPVPITTYNEQTWKRWVFEQCLRTMNHEIGESLMFNGIRPFPPMHGPGEDPYTVHEIRPERDALTTQDGSLRPGPV